MHQIDRLTGLIKLTNNPSTIGLDTRIEYIPQQLLPAGGVQSLEDAAATIFDYNKALIDTLADIIPSVKIQAAYYEMLGVSGMQTFKNTIDYAKSAGLCVIADVKRNDIGATAQAYSAAYLSGVRLGDKIFTVFDADIITVNPYLGSDGIMPFTKACAENDKGIFVLVKTSNPSSGELQDEKLANGKSVFMHMGSMVANWGNDDIGESGYSSVGAVVGATYPEESAALRRSMPHTFFLVPGYGAQGAAAADLAGAFDARGGGAVVNASRSVLCAWQKNTKVDYKTAAREEVMRMRDDINAAVSGKAGGSI